MKDLKKERLFELLAEQAVFGLDEKELTELEQLKRQFSDWERQYNSFELVAAAVSLSNLEASQKLPANLRTKISLDADKFFSREEKSQNVLGFASRTKESAATDAVAEPKRPFWQWLGWAIAAAACLALIVNIWTTRSKLPVDVAKNPSIVQTPTPELTPAQQRQQLLAAAPDVIQTNWTEANPKAPKNVSGDIIWSNSAQKGFMRFRGLPANDPNQETYQLWIVDETQNPKTPISGGVFDVNENGEVVIPIEAQIKVKKPKAFAVTKEKPGGVVVSKQENVMAIAKI